MLLRHMYAIALAACAATLHGAEHHVGPQGQPFKTIQQAADAMKPGDTCVIHAGVYRETVRPAGSGAAGQPLRFVAAPGERVVVSGADELSPDWAVHRGAMYKTPAGEPFIQLFVDGQMMTEARWPNTPLGDIMTMNRAAAGEGTDYDRLADPNLPAGDWDGALVLLWPGSRWTNSTRRVVDYRPGQGFRFGETLKRKRRDPYHQQDPYRPKPGNPYILFGALAGLDAPGEWVLDRSTGTVYLRTPDDRSPREHRVEVKRRDFAFNLNGLSQVQLHDLHVFAAALDMRGSRHCVVEDCRLEYVDHFREVNGYSVRSPKNSVSGEGNLWRRCLVAYSAGTALRVTGKGNRLDNSIIHDADYTGSVASALNISNSEGTVVSRCSIYRGGRDLIGHGRAKGIRIEYCDLHHANMLNNDSGATYCWGTDGAGSVIAYNWVHDNMGDHTMGIYVDNFSSNFIVHHNVVWSCSNTGIRLNSDALSHLVCNNTVVRCLRPIGTYTYHNRVPTQKGTRIINNLFLGLIKDTDPRAYVQGELGPERRCNGYGAIGANGVPTAGSAAVDAGVRVPGITDGFVGRGPDLGAYERGGKYWQPGADWCTVRTRPDIGFAPQPPVTEAAMIAAGLNLWLDANDPATLELDPAGRVTRWLDKSGGKRHATAGDGFTVVPGALAGKPVVRSAGKSGMAIPAIRSEPGPVTAFVVSQNLETGGGPWQRILGSWSGKGEEWVVPNWIIIRPHAAKVEPYPAQLFLKQAADKVVIDRLNLFAAPSGPWQFLVGDVAEALIYDRALRFDELAAIEAYLKSKWGLR